MRGEGQVFVHPLAAVRRAHGWSLRQCAEVIAAHAEVNMAAALIKYGAGSTGKLLPIWILSLLSHKRSTYQPRM
jgi:hypothetical protein